MKPNLLGESIHEVISAVVLCCAFSINCYVFIFVGTARAAFIPFCAIPVSLIGVFYLYAFIGFLNKSVNFVRAGSCRRFGCR